VDRRIQDFLESQNFDVDTTYELDLSTETDLNIVDYCLRNNYVILSHDDDFLSIVDGMDVYPTVIKLPQRIRFREMKRRLEDLEIPDKTNKEIFP